MIKREPADRTDLAELLNKMLINKMNDSKRNALYEKHLLQENCELNFPRVNDFIWQYCMNQDTRSTDVKLHIIQKGLLKRIIPIISV